MLVKLVSLLKKMTWNIDCVIFTDLSGHSMYRDIGLETLHCLQKYFLKNKVN